MHIAYLPLTYVLDRLQLPPLKTEVDGALTALVMTTIVVNDSCQSGKAKVRPQSITLKEIKIYVRGLQTESL